MSDIHAFSARSISLSTILIPLAHYYRLERYVAHLHHILGMGYPTNLLALWATTDVHKQACAVMNQVRTQRRPTDDPRRPPLHT